MAKSNVQVKHMVRSISTSGMATPEGAMPVEQVDAAVAEKLSEGYELKTTQYLGELPGGAGLRILYIFVKNGAV